MNEKISFPCTCGGTVTVEAGMPPTGNPYSGYYDPGSDPSVNCDSCEDDTFTYYNWALEQASLVWQDASHKEYDPAED